MCGTAQGGQVRQLYRDMPTLIKVCFWYVLLVGLPAHGYAAWLLWGK